MTRYLKAAAITILALLTLVPVASAQRRVVVLRGGFYGPGWGWYSPYPYWGWGPPYGYPVPDTGTVKLISPMKNESVYVDGGYAGKADKLKKFSLSPGTHNVELRNSDGQTIHEERVQVISGKTVEINAG
jgi:hypothetical protein